MPEKIPQSSDSLSAEDLERIKEKVLAERRAKGESAPKPREIADIEDPTAKRIETRQKKAEKRNK